jgi:hypothetical protein
LDDVTSPDWRPETRTDELAVAIGAKQLTQQQAVDAFALLYPEMPGATPTELSPGDGLDATYTWMLIRSVYDRLAPDQRALVDRAAESEPIGLIDLDGNLTETELAAEAIPGAPKSPDTTGPGGFVGRRAPTTYAHFARLARQTYIDWHAHRADMPPYTIQVAISRVPFFGGGMQTGVVDGVPGRCEVTIDPNFARAGLGDSLIKFFFAHEFFHCIQFQWNPALDWQVAKWVFDGSADFAAADVYRNVFAPGPRYLQTRWFTSPSRPLAGRWYDAWPVFDTLWEEGTDPYPGIRAMIAGVTSADPAAALALAGMDGLLFRMKWSSRSLRSNQHPAEDWQLDWPGGRPAAGPRDNRSPAGSRGVGSYNVVGKGDFAHPQQVVAMSSEVGLVEVTPVGGPLTTQTADGVLHVAEGSTATLCFDASGCVCPEGTTVESVQMIGREVIFSFAAAAQPTMAKVEAVKWDPEKYCHMKKPRRGSSNGDPHLLTFDGLPLDVMTLGEIVTTRDPTGGFEVQARHVPTPSFSGAGTSAVAIGTGGHRVTFAVADLFDMHAPVVRLDGVEISDTDFMAGDVRVRTDDGSATLSWPDGSIVELSFHAGWFVSVTPSEERAGRLVGLLGSADGDFTNDLLMPDGKVVDPVRAAAPDSDWSLAWRVDEGSTLFDYAPGEAVETFQKPYTGSPLTALADAAVERCAAALGERATEFEVRSCAYDVSATGEDEYVDAYIEVVQDRVAAEQGVPIENEATSPPPVSVAQGNAGAPAVTLSGTLVASYGNPSDDAVFELSATVAAKAGTVLVLRAERCAPGVILFVDVTRDTGSAGHAFVCDPSNIQLRGDDDDEATPGEVYFWLPAEGDYTVEIDTDADDPVFVSVDAFVDPDPTILEPKDVIAAGYRGTLRGVGDTVVIATGDESADFDATGLGVACATTAYGASSLGSDEVWSLAAYCAHAETASVPGADVPVVIFSRTDEPVDIALTPR